MTELPVVYGRDCVGACAVMCFRSPSLLKEHVALYGAELVVVFLDAVSADRLIHDIRDDNVEGADNNVPIIAVDVPSAPEEARTSAIGAMATMLRRGGARRRHRTHHKLGRRHRCNPRRRRRFRRGQEIMAEVALAPCFSGNRLARMSGRLPRISALSSFWYF